MVWFQDTGPQNPLALRICRGLLVLKDKELLSQGFVDLDCLLVLGAGAPSLSVGLTLPYPCMKYA